MMIHTLSRWPKSFLQAVCMVCCVFFLMQPSKSWAVVSPCEVTNTVFAGATVLDDGQFEAVLAMTEALKEAFLFDEEAAKLYLMYVFEIMETNIIARLDWFWGEWQAALQDMTAQLHGGVIDQNMKFGLNEDANTVAETLRQEQEQKLAAKNTYQPTTQEVRFDSLAKYIGPSKELSRSVSTAYALDFNKLGNNNKNSPSGSGRAAMQKWRWQMYQSKFCDKKNNGGFAGCTTSQQTSNMNVLPGKTIFAKPTLNMANADTRDSVNQLLLNITGYDPPDLIAPSALSSTTGLQQLRENREYTTQMDAVGDLAYSVVAERVPGQKAAEVQQIRQKAGVTDASSKPSAREIRQAIVDQLNDPTYYKELFDKPETISKKELYLKAYSLLMLNDMIAKQEKISNAYAIETANMLDGTDDGRGNATIGTPVR